MCAVKGKYMHSRTAYTAGVLFKLDGKLVKKAWSFSWREPIWWLG